MAEFPRTPTPLDRYDLAAQMLLAYRRAFGADPSRVEAELLFALLSHEVGNGRSIIQHNWGNVMARGTQNYWLPPWATDPEHKWYRDPNTPQRFRAFPTHREGADQWFRTLRNTTNLRIVEAARAGSVDRMWRAVSTPHPTTGAAYCPHCTSNAVRDQYAQLAEQARRDGIFADLTGPHSDSGRINQTANNTATGVGLALTATAAALLLAKRKR